MVTDATGFMVSEEEDITLGGAARGGVCAQPDGVRGSLHRRWGWTLEPPCAPGALAPR